MAKEVVKKEVKTGTKKRGRRLKRSVRKTLGALFMATAIAVAAIPTDGLQAAVASNREKKVTAHNFDDTDVSANDRSMVPLVDPEAPIYSTGDGKLTFAYVDYRTGKAKSEDNTTPGVMVAVILQCNVVGSLVNNTLEIPNEVDAYKQFFTGSTSGQYCAVNKEDKFLYYRTLEKTVDESGNPVWEMEDGVPKKDSNGQNIQATHYEYHPCYYNDRDKWEKTAEDQFYFKDESGSELDPDGITRYSRTATDAVTRIHNATVGFIGEQTLKTESSEEGGTILKVGDQITDPLEGIFARQGQIYTLKVGKDLMGIGSYAFYNCSGIKSVELGSGIYTIGNSAFQNCNLLSDVSVPFISNLYLIGDHAFANCQALASFTAPVSLAKIGDSAFEDCINLTTISLTGTATDKGSSLEELGYDVFSGCKSLQRITFPNSLNETVDPTLFRGCTSLEYIETESTSFSIVDGNGEDSTSKTDYQDPEYTIKEFKEDMGSDFYLKGPKVCSLHNMATENQIAYGYYDETLRKNVYELTVEDDEGNKAVYRVDEENNLIEHEMDAGMDTVEIPAAIGPYGIGSIDSWTFRNNCNIKKVIIPSTIKRISEWAFKGCHNLKYVIFDNPASDLKIENNAFKTQDLSDNIYMSGCNVVTDSRKHDEALLDKNPKLYFVGPISYTSEPFRYAMDSSSNINNGNQTSGTYITYYSGWPSNLEVRYNPDTDKNELIDYPTITEIGQQKYNKDNYPYITDEYETNAREAISKWNKTVSGLGLLTGYQREVIEAALYLELPEGIESIQDDLFKNKEGTEALSYPAIEKTIRAESLHEVAAETFEGHQTLVSVELSNETTSIGDHAFKDCTKLTRVILPNSVSKLGLSPFIGCDLLQTVDFSGGEYYDCKDSIIFELNNGKNNKVVEVLKGRVNPEIGADELEGITEIYSEAFMGTDLITVNLQKSRIEVVPKDAFSYTESLTTVSLPTTIKELAKDAFRKSSIRVLRIPAENVIFNEGIFGTDYSSVSGGDDETATYYPSRITLVGWAGSMVERYANSNGLNFSETEEEHTFTVRFYDYFEEQIGEPQVITSTLSEPGSAVAPEPGVDFDKVIKVEEDGEEKELEFSKWSTNAWMSVTKDIDVYATYKDVKDITYTVTFQDYNGREILKQTVAKGKAAIMPQSPSRMNEDPPWVFDGWVLSGGNGEFLTQQSSSLTNVQSDMLLIAQYHLAREGETVDPGTGKTPTPSPGASGSPSPGTSGSPSPGTSGSPSPGASGTLYTLTVQNGSGSGSYVEGAQPVIIANDPATGQVFDYWSVSPDDVKIASTVLSASVITMPAKDVTVTAHFKAGSGSGSGSGSGTTGSSNNAQRPNGVVESASSGTTVVIDKNGLSNTGVVSATVNGSSDDFVIKITDTAEATEAAVRALMEEYGDNWTNVRYFPMDISLYDSTGTTKITDTTGLSVDITLPLPDSMITYAGNNRVASTTGGRLERLDGRFSTIQGVSCITFTAEHFSPYMIYVDLGDLSSGLVSDNTPQTGDGIHPKWFLSIGLACLSIVFFMQKDSRKQPKKVKVKVRAR